MLCRFRQAVERPRGSGRVPKAPLEVETLLLEVACGSGFTEGDGDSRQPHEGSGNTGNVSQLPLDCETLPKERARLLGISVAVSQPALQIEHLGDACPVSGLLMDRQTFRRQRGAGFEVLPRAGQSRGRLQSASAGGCANRSGRQSLVQPAAPLRPVAPHPPEVPQIARQALRRLGVRPRLVEKPAQRGAQVVVLGSQPIEPRRSTSNGPNSRSTRGETARSGRVIAAVLPSREASSDGFFAPLPQLSSSPGPKGSTAGWVEDRRGRQQEDTVYSMQNGAAVCPRTLGGPDPLRRQ